MKPENEMNEEVRQLLDSLEEHGKNARRQQELGDLIDRLAINGSGTVPSLRGTKRRKLYPLWWAIGAAAACLLLWLLVKPNAKQQPEMEQEILVEETKTVDSVKTEVKDIILEEPVVEEELLAEETTTETGKSESGLLRSPLPRNDVKETIQEQLLAENTATEPLVTQEHTDTANIGSNTTPTENETPSAVQKPQRRVIQSLNLVCYECQKEPEFFIKPVMEDRTLFGQPQDPNMKNGSLAFEIKLN
jgi:hypothetical protein